MLIKVRLAIGTLLAFAAATMHCAAQESRLDLFRPGAEIDLGVVGATTAEELQTVTSVSVSNDGHFLYAAAWNASAVSVYRINEGSLEHIQTIQNPDLAGAVDILLSPDNRLAAVAAFGSRKVLLFQRDDQTGELSIVDMKSELGWIVDLAFSADGRFLYVADGHGAGTSDAPLGAIIVLEVNDQSQLSLVQKLSGVDFAGMRGVALHPDGGTVYATCSTAGTLIALERDPDTGKVSIGQVLRDEEEGVHGLSGVMSSVVSPDGKFVYTVSGRFHGDDAVSVFQRDSEGDLQLIQQFFSGDGGLDRFQGGNGIAISPDGSRLYATATNSGALACFTRDRETGELIHLETLNEVDDPGTLAGAVGIDFTPDGRFAFVAAELAQSISVFRRTGVEDPLPSAAGPEAYASATTGTQAGRFAITSVDRIAYLLDSATGATWSMPVGATSWQRISGGPASETAVTSTLLETD